MEVSVTLSRVAIYFEWLCSLRCTVAVLVCLLVAMKVMYVQFLWLASQLRIRAEPKLQNVRWPLIILVVWIALTLSISYVL